MPKNPFGAAFRVGDLVKFRRLDSEQANAITALVPMWPAPPEYEASNCIWVPCTSLGVVLDVIGGSSFKIITSFGDVGWVDTWDLEPV